MDRRNAIRALSLGGAGAGLLGRGEPLSAATVRPLPLHSDGRAIDLVINGVSAWLPDSEGNGRVVHDVAVRVENNRIAEIRVGGTLSGGFVTNFRSHLLLPGLISGHTHVAGGSATRGLIEGGRSYARPLLMVEELLDDPDLDALTAYNLAELIRSGCTTQIEMSLSLRQAQSYARVAARLGARGWVGGMVPGITRLFPIWTGDDPTLQDSVPDSLAEIEANRVFAENLNRAGGLVRGMMTPHAADTHTPETRSAIAEAVRSLGTGLHTHLSQGARETETVRRRWGSTPTQWWSDAGLMDGPFFGAHFTAPDWVVDPPLLRDHGGVYVTCPSAGGAGGDTQPFPEALGAGLAVNVGIDTHSNDMIENLKLAVLLGQARAHMLRGRVDGLPSRAPTVEDTVRGATSIAAAALRREDLGRLEVGATADLVLIDVGSFLVGSGARPPEPLHNLLYCNGLAVEFVMVDGRPLVSEGVLTVGNEQGIVREGGRVMQRIWRELEREGWFEA